MMLCAMGGGVIQELIILIYSFRTMGYKQSAMNVRHSSVVR